MTITTHPSDPLVTIIIPSYNRAHIITTAVKSALEQTYKNIEVIVVDDGSVDNTEEVLRTAFPDDLRLRYYRHSPNRGGNYARNRGIDLARGEYVTFLDSDDTYLPTKVEKQVAAARTLAPTRPHVVQCQIMHIVDGKTPKNIAPIAGKPSAQSAADYIFLGPGQSHMPLLLISTSHARAIRFDEQLPKLQDWDWYIRVFDNNPEYAFVAEALATYVTHHSDDQISKTLPPHDIMAEWVSRLGTRLSARAHAYLQATRLALYAANEGRRILVLKYIKEGIRHNVMPQHSLIALAARVLLPQKIHTTIIPFARRFKAARYF